MSKTSARGPAPAWWRIEELHQRGQYGPFLRRALSFVSRWGGEPAHAWTLIADAHRRSGQPCEALHALEEGLKRFPESGLLHASLGNALVRSSTGSREMRMRVVRLWRRAREIERKQGYNTFDQLKQEVDNLKRTPLEVPYPPVTRPLLRVLASLREHGIFKERTLDDLVESVIEELGFEDARPRSTRAVNVLGLLSLQGSRAWSYDHRFVAVDVVRSWATLVAPCRLGFEIEEEGEVNRHGERALRVRAYQRVVEARIHDLNSLVELFNREVPRGKLQRRFYRLKDGGDGFSYMFLTPVAYARARRCPYLPFHEES